MQDYYAKVKVLALPRVANIEDRFQKNEGESSNLYDLAVAAKQHNQSARASRGKMD